LGVALPQEIELWRSLFATKCGHNIHKRRTELLNDRHAKQDRQTHTIYAVHMAENK